MVLVVLAMLSPGAALRAGETEIPSAPAAGFQLGEEPHVRIGLLRNATVATISTRDGALVAEQAFEPRSVLGANSVRVSSRPYNPPVFEYHLLEIPAIADRDEAERTAERIRSATGDEVFVLVGKDPDTWRVRIESEIDLLSEAEARAAALTERGFAEVRIVTVKYNSPSDEAIELSRQIARMPKSKVRSLLSGGPAGALPSGGTSSGLVQKTAASLPSRRRNMNAVIAPGLREVLVSGAGTSLSTLRAVTIGSSDPRGTVYLNGRRYRGKMEVFVNAAGRITVVNVVPIEDYLLGVVPAELSLPQLEAQKAQAVAARTYALGNKDDYADEGFDMVDTVWSQVYKGVAIESAMGTRAVRETRGVYAFYDGKPINAMFTSTCGGRTENSGNIYEFDLPYLRGVDCSLEGERHFVPFLVRTEREPAVIRNEANYELVRLASRYAVNNFLFATPRFDDDYFDDPPTETELRSWLGQLAGRFGKPAPLILPDTARPLKLARTLHTIIYTPDAEADADTLMSEADIDYQLSFLDAGEVPPGDRVMLAQLLRDGWFSIYPDLTIKPRKAYSRGKIIRLIDHIFNKKKWDLPFESGTAEPTEDGKLILRSGRSGKEISVHPQVFLFRKFGDSFYQVKETALVGGETVRYRTDALGQVVYLEVEPTDGTTVAERMSPFTVWRKNMSAGQVRAGLGRYVKGLGALVDVRVKERGVSKRAVELEIVTTNGVHKLRGGKIRSALRLREQLFVMDKRYDSSGRVTSFSFTGRGWGHGIGMCQYGAYGFAKMGVTYDRILKHYYTGIELVKAY